MFQTTTLVLLIDIELYRTNRHRTVIYFSSSLHLSRNSLISSKLLNLNNCIEYFLVVLSISVEYVLPDFSFMTLMICVFSLFLLLHLGRVLSTLLILKNQLSLSLFSYCFSVLHFIGFPSDLEHLLLSTCPGLVCCSSSCFLR